MVAFHFNLSKSIQALAFLLRQPGVDNDRYLKIVKLLYLAERESILETGHPITGDKTVAMPHGTALSHIVNLIRGKITRAEWSRAFKVKQYRLEVIEDPGEDLLCKYEMDKLKEIGRRFKDDDRWKMKGITHQLPEYKKNNPGKSSREIPLADILEAGGKSALLQKVRSVARAEVSFAKIFGK